jgi:hypothetical protein
MAKIATAPISSISPTLTIFTLLPILAMLSVAVIAVKTMFAMLTAIATTLIATFLLVRGFKVKSEKH